MPGTRCGPCSRTWIDDRFEQRFGAEIVPVWGQTELGALAAAGRSGDRDRPASCVGSPMPGTDIVEIRDPEGRALPSDSVGEIHVRSPWVMRGYWGQPKLSGQVLRDGWDRDRRSRLSGCGWTTVLLRSPEGDHQAGRGEHLGARARGGDRRASRRRGVCLLQRSGPAANRGGEGGRRTEDGSVARPAGAREVLLQATRGLQGSPLLGGLRRAAPDALLEGRLRRARRSA